MPTLHAVFLSRLLGAALVCCGWMAQAQSLPSGTYATEGGWGKLVVGPVSAGAQAFEINVLGGNAHTCQLDGRVSKGWATLEGDADRPCKVRFEPTANGWRVSDGSEGACNGYCGMRADFQGVYEALPKACEGSAVVQARRRFKQQYDGKRFQDALATLQPLWNQCSRWLHWSEAGRIRNDLAITLHHLGDLAGCKAVLAPLAEDAQKTDAQIREDWPPTDADVFLPIARATRTNLKLCNR